MKLYRIQQLLILWHIKKHTIFCEACTRRFEPSKKKEVDTQLIVHLVELTIKTHMRPIKSQTCLRQSNHSHAFPCQSQSNHRTAFTCFSKTLFLIIYEY